MNAKVSVFVICYICYYINFFDCTFKFVVFRYRLADMIC